VRRGLPECVPVGTRVVAAGEAEAERDGLMEEVRERAAVLLPGRVAVPQREAETVVEMVREGDTEEVGVEGRHLTALGMYV
jgi:hypothetical protein